MGASRRLGHYRVPEANTARLRCSGPRSLLQGVREVTVPSDRTWADVLRRDLEIDDPAGIIVCSSHFRVTKNPSPGWKAHLTERVSTFVRKFARKMPVYCVKLHLNRGNPRPRPAADPFRVPTSKRVRFLDDPLRVPDEHLVSIPEADNNLPSTSGLCRNREENHQGGQAELYFDEGSSVVSMLSETEQRMKLEGKSSEEIKKLFSRNLKDIGGGLMRRVQEELDTLRTSPDWVQYKQMAPHACTLLEQFFRGTSKRE